MADLPDENANHPKYTRTKQNWESAAAKARLAQSRYRTYTRGFVIGTAVAAIAAGLVLYGIEENPEQASDQLIRLFAIPWVRATLQIIQAVGLFAAAFCATVLATRKYAEVWIDSRLEAERGRLAQEKLALELGHDAGAHTFKAAGAAFNAFADGQLRHLSERSGKHDRAAGFGAVAGALLAGLAALAGVAGGVQNVTVIALIALLGVCTPALISALNLWSEAIRNTARARLHEDNRKALTDVLAEQTEFDAVVASNDLPTALAYAERVFDVLRADHAEFGKIHGTDRA